ncbi:RNA methyltransferase [Bifidobacterium sp. ESL0763]|uniref:TrmH family RNA methyltransferase n=1 Tax=Bifidobacterium sp. ESL0763 TaxID=2983227 RepID=UPI0023F62E64|nr:RNA methyltransferase [Bifidobacterium sp. ESL0763]MDF7663714.1 RNA methyltransferase [Bifidobacterium sp. ESL0763]
MPFNPHIIDNPKSERIRHVAGLQRSKGRKRAGRFLVEGPQSVRELVRWMPGVVRDCYAQLDDRGQGLLSPVVDRIARDADGQGLYVHQVTGEVMRHISADSQGILAVGDLEAMREGMRHDFDGQGERGGETYAAFWQVRDPGNAGTVIRSADAAGCRAVIFVDDCVDRFNPKVIRSTAGSLFHLPVVTMGTDEFFAWRAGKGLAVMAADVYGTEKARPESLVDVLDGERDRVGRTDESAGRAILFGNEARGLPGEVLKRVDRIVSIPLYGKAESLNLATSTSVMLMSLAMAGHVREG